MTKSMIAPFLTLIALLAKTAFHYEISNDLLNAGADVVLAAYSAYGIWKNHK